MNKITIFGRLTADVETKQSSAGKTIALVRIAENGRSKEDVNYFDCKAFSGAADTIAKYFHKGDQIFVAGSMKQNTFNAQDGTRVTKWEMLIDDFAFVGGGAKKEPQAPVEESAEESGPLPF